MIRPLNQEFELRLGSQARLPRKGLVAIHPKADLLCSL